MVDSESSRGVGLRSGSRYVPWLLVAVLMAVLAGCGGSSSDSATTASGSTAASTASADADTASGDAIVVGAVGPLSEPGAVSSGKEMQWAMNAAVAKINDAGGVLGRPLKLVFEDTQGLPDVGASVAQKMVDETKPVAILGEAHSSAALAAIPTYEAAGLPSIWVNTWDDRITGGDPEDAENLPESPKGVFRINPTTSYVNGVQVSWMTEGMKAKKVVQIYEATDYGSGSVETMKKLLGDAGVELVPVEVELNQPDYTAIVSRLAQEHDDADVVFVDVTGDSGFVVEQNAKDAGLIDDDTAMLANGQASESKSFWSAVPDGKGIVFPVTGPLVADFNEQTTSVRDAYTQKFGTQPTYVVYYAYDSVYLLADAIKTAGSTDADGIIKALEGTSYVGSAGPYEFAYGSAKPVPADEPSWMWHQLADPGFNLYQYTETDQLAEEAPVVWPKMNQTDPGVAFNEVDG